MHPRILSQATSPAEESSSSNPTESGAGDISANPDPNTPATISKDITITAIKTAATASPLSSNYSPNHSITSRFAFFKNGLNKPASPAERKESIQTNSPNKRKSPKAFYIPFDSPTSPRRRSSHHVRVKSLGKHTMKLPTEILSSLEKRLKNLQISKMTKTLFQDIEDEIEIRKPAFKRPRARHVTFPNSLNQDDLIAMYSTAQHLRVAYRREKQMKMKQLKLRLQNQQKKYVKVIQKEKEKMDSIRLKIKTDLSLQTAQLKRQLILQRKIEKYGAEVERAQGISLLNNLEKRLRLTRSFSADFSNDIKRAVIEDEERDAEDQYLESPKGFYYSDSSSTPSLSPIAASPAGRSLKQNLTVGMSTTLSAIPSPASPTQTAKSPIVESTGPPPLIITRKRLDKLSIVKNQGGLGTLKRSHSAPSILSLKTLITQMHLGCNVGLPMKIQEMLPPITRYTLRELDFDQIMSNIQLRHNLIFDANMQFMPNDEGDRGAIRKEKTNEFFGNLQKSLDQMQQTLTKSEKKTKKSLDDYLKHPYFLSFPVLINEIKEIMLDILPYSRYFHEELNAHIDIDLIGQQMEHAVMNYQALIEYIGKTLKTHCAPIRDTKIDEMVKICKEGKIVETIKMCFDILELMKLDIANHQLLQIRPQVIEDSVSYEWNYFKDQMELGIRTVEVTERWFMKFALIQDPFDLNKNMNGFEGLQRSNSAVNVSESGVKPAPIIRSASVPFLNTIETEDESTTPVGTPKAKSLNLFEGNDRHSDAARTLGGLTAWMDLFYKATLFLIASTNAASGIDLPETFYLDLDRLHDYHNEWQDITILSCLLILYRQSAGPKVLIDSAQMKKELLVLLDDPDTTLPHLNLHILAAAEKARKRVFTDQERGILSSTIDKTLSPDSSLFDLLHTRVAMHLFLFLKEGKVFPEILAKHGLSEMQKEITDLGKKIKTLAEHNRKTYAPAYLDLAKKFGIIQ